MATKRSCVILISCLVTAFFLFSCDSNDKLFDSPEPPPATKLTGVFSDAPVEGLSYSTSSGLSGTTNAAGEFEYEDGDTVTFTIADIPIGEAPGQAVISVFDVSGAPMPRQNQLTKYVNGFIQMNNTDDALVRRGLNLAMFLQALDDDSQPDNGITLSSDSLGKLVGANLILDKPQFEFAFRLRRLLTAVQIAKAPPSALRTVQHLVSQGVISTDLFRPVRQEQTFVSTRQKSLLTNTSFPAISGNNLEQIIGQQREQFLAKYGRALSQNKAENASATGPVITTYGYDATGNLILEEVDSDGDGAVNSSTSYTYDANANRLSASSDHNNDGVINASFSYTYDSNNFLILEEWDFSNDGTPDYTFRNTYDANGNLLDWGQDTDGDGQLEFICNLTYNAAGNRESEECSDPGGTIYVVFYIYDAEQNNISQVDIDENGDGTINQVTYYSYDASDRIVLLEIDLGNDGTINHIVSVGYDENNNRTLQSVDLDGDGVIEQGQALSYDANGNLTRLEFDENGDSIVDRLFSFSYDANNNRTLFEIDNDNNGVFDSRESMSYDGDDNLISTEIDFNADGTAEQLFSYTYEASPILIIFLFVFF